MMLSKQAQFGKAVKELQCQRTGYEYDIGIWIQLSWNVFLLVFLCWPHVTLCLVRLPCFSCNIISHTIDMLLFLHYHTFFLSDRFSICHCCWLQFQNVKCILISWAVHKKPIQCSYVRNITLLSYHRPILYLAYGLLFIKVFLFISLY